MFVWRNSYKKKMELNCRVCLQIRDVMIHIFEEVDQFHTDLASLLENCGGINIDLDDSFPKYLCQECIQELLGVAEFRQKCKLATELLMEMHEKELEERRTVEHVQKKGSSVESSVLYEPVLIDDESVDMSLTDPMEQNNTKLDAVEINIVFDDDPNSAGVVKPSTNDDTTNEGNVIQLVLPKGSQGDNNDIEEAVSEVDVETSDSEAYVNVYDSVEFADSIIEVLESEETEISPEHIAVVYPTTSVKSTDTHNFVCTACGASFIKAANLRRHMENAHRAVLEFFCEKCHRKFATEKDFERHVDLCCLEIQEKQKKSVPKDSENMKNANQTSNKYICDFCGKCLQSLFSLRMHERIHTGEKPFKCDKCQSTFKTQGGLTSHIKRHEGNADLICEVCEKRFIDPSNLIAHRRTHTGVRPHICNVCNQAFTRVYLLQLHMRTHTGEKPFQCEYCLKTFSQSADLSYHIAVHTGNRKYSCPLCSKTFIRRDKLVLHMEKHSMPQTQQTLQDDNTTPAEENGGFPTNSQNDLDVDDINVHDDD